jgi:hypothetical protein
MITRPILRSSLLFVLFSLPLVAVRAELSQKQARKTIAKAAGMSLPSSAVHIERVVSSSDTSAEVTTQLELVFRFAKAEHQWRIREVRTGEAQWEDVEAITQALKIDVVRDKCSAPDENSRGTSTSELTNQRARCLVANLFSITLPSDAVRIKDISGLSIGTQPSAIAVTLVQADFRLTKDSGGWHVTGFRSGNRDWTTVESAPSVLDSVKRERTTEDLKAIATALEAFRKERGSFVISDKHSALIDVLTPRFLSRVIRVDSWRHAYRYHGEHDTFTLRSLGPDGKENTTDDIVISN